MISGVDSKIHSSSFDEFKFDRSPTRIDVEHFSNAANRQHYEIPAAFFESILGPRRKYSCGYFDGKELDLELAECASLKKSSEYAQLEDDIDILELGCGWGSLTIWMAQNYPKSRIQAVTNSEAQVSYIQNILDRDNITNVDLVKSDVNSLSLDRRFDRVVSIEMIEHIRDWKQFFVGLKGFCKPEALLYFHHFHHISKQYIYDEKTSWMARHFFTGGLMPSHDSIRDLKVGFDICSTSRWSGVHYERTARCWLDNYDRNYHEIAPLLKEVYGSDWRIWLHRWRLFFLGVERMFAWEKGGKWGISHYTLKLI